MPSRTAARTILLLIAAISVGQTAPTTPPMGAPATSPAAAPSTASATVLSPLRVTLMDGSIVAGKLSTPDLTIVTRFGTLKVPVDSIRSFAPGLKSHPDFDKKLASLINDLSAEGFADREKAQEQLLALGLPIKGELEKQLKTAEAEKEMRLSRILEDFESASEDASSETAALAWIPEDVIVTDGFTVVGRISTDSFTVASPYGTLQLKLADVREARRAGVEPEEIRKTVTVPGSSVGNHVFVASGIRLARGDQVSITATGQIQMTPFGGNMHSGPDGGNNFGQMQPENIPGGTLIGRVGKNGDIFKTGSKHSFTAAQPGVLEFGIAMNGDFAGNAFPGEYTVKVKIVRKP